MNRNQILRCVRRATWVTAILGAMYLFIRYDTINLEGGESPIFRYGQGQRLLVDLRFNDLEVNNAVIVRGHDQGLHLVLVEKIDPDQGVWVRVDHPEAYSSEQSGWLALEAVLGRVILALPW
jgi:hypothetical protein